MVAIRLSIQPSVPKRSALLGHSADEAELHDTRRVVRAILQVRAVLVQRAHQHGKPELAAALTRDVHVTGAGTDRALDAVRRLEYWGRRGRSDRQVAHPRSRWALSRASRG